MSEYQDQELQSWLDSNDLISLDTWCELAGIQEDDLIKAGFLAYTKKGRYSRLTVEKEGFIETWTHPYSFKRYMAVKKSQAKDFKIHVQQGLSTSNPAFYQPLLSLTTDQLESLYKDSSADKLSLEKVLDELSHRTSKKAKALATEIQDSLNSKGQSFESKEPMRDAVTARETEADDIQEGKSADKVEKANDFSYESLESLRKRLLDLTGKNRLLNFRYSKAGEIRVIDELPDQLHEFLISDRRLNFEPVPEPLKEELIFAGYIEVDEETGEEKLIKPNPTAMEWAKYLGFNTNYELPDLEESKESKHNDTAIQTLLYPFELEARLRTLRSKSVTAIEETGSNYLYLSFGFLEWFESADSDQSRSAPLYLIPVSIEKGRLDQATMRYVYTITYTGEDIVPNLSLQEKLRIDFGLGLPDFEEINSPEGYFTELNEIIRKNQPRWRVKRQCSLALLEFGNLLMYLDLDPNKWPEGPQNITNHNIVSRFFATSSNVDENDGAAAAGSFSDEYLIDRLENVHEHYPLIDDADSSQHSAVVDAIKGKNLVIEGPPGTGKSQTITNIIAAAISQGKTVLFVAEKLAALEVVKRRLDQAQLGDFCLELHSHKTQKRKLLDNISRRLAKQSKFKAPSEIDTEIARYEDLKDKLNSYVQLINSNWKDTGRTIHQILNGAALYRERLDAAPTKVHPTGVDGLSCTRVFHREVLDNIRLYKDVFNQVSEQLGTHGRIDSHPWHGVQNTELQVFDSPEVTSTLDEWTKILKALDKYFETVVAELGIDLSFLTFEDAKSFIDTESNIPSFYSSAHLGCLELLNDKVIIEVQELLDLTEKIQKHYVSLSNYVSDQWLDDLSLISELRNAQKSLELVGVSKKANLEDIAKSTHRIDRLINSLDELKNTIDELSSRLGKEFSSYVTITQDGLNEFAAFIVHVVKLPPALLKYRNECFDDDELDIELPILKEEVDRLTQQKGELAKTYSLTSLPPVQELKDLHSTIEKGKFFKWLKSDWRTARKNLLSGAVDSNISFPSLVTRLPELISYAESVELLNSNKDYKRLLGDHFQGLETKVDNLCTLREWYSNIRSYYGVGFGSKASLGSVLINISADIAKGIHSMAENGIQDKIDATFKDIDKTAETIPDAALFRDKLHLLGELESEPSLKKLSVKLKILLAPCQNALTKKDMAFDNFVKVVEALQNLFEMKAKWDSFDIDERVLDGRLKLQIGRVALWEAPYKAAKNTVALAKYFRENGCSEHYQAALYHKPEISTVDELRSISQRFQKYLADVNIAYESFLKLTDLDLSSWEKNTDGTVKSLAERNSMAVTKAPWLATWVDFIRCKVQLNQSGYSSLIENIETALIPIEEIEGYFYLGTYDLLAREILKEHSDLSHFSGQKQSAIQRQFCEYDERLKGLQRERIAFLSSRKKVPAGKSGGKVSNYTELSLLKHECGKKTRHIPIRKLIKQAGQALIANKPCFMMGPKSVAQYLPPGEITFDLVVIDEASQVKPQDALGAIARGKQLVVVGDPKQLPPTSFFDKHGDEEDDDEVTGIQQSESVLGAAAPLFPMRRLRWHYRSQHEQLIAFSNYSFYDSNLVVFPSPNQDSPEFGVKFHKVSKGRFINRRNIEEARAIANSVAEHLIKTPNESLGVVAMNSTQSEQIDRAVEELVRGNKTLQSALEENQSKNEPLFIKNLENVQGDERDVIFISCTYGPHDAQGGEVMQRFGPINSDVGWRRLNVLFTRSKKRMHIFSSMEADDIKVSNTSSRGIIAFKNFLGFAKSGQIHQPVHTGKAADSDFEISVAEALSRYGYQCEPQVGVAGFFIDLAVIDPGKSGRYLMGVECDGATYHSAKSARDRDRLRQSVLERLGWKIRRIWSTDWFKNPEGQIQPLVAELDKLKTLASCESVDESLNINEIILEQDHEEEAVDTIEIAKRSLVEQLREYDEKVIRIGLPDTQANKRLLRPAMVEALLHERPCDILEFQEVIAPYLRADTDSKEGQYLPEVLRIISEHKKL
ncbi:DUF4011 domain-containing protein [Amphritea sp. 1_MG-2023]|uniref:DUF4011 domain-containing anti-phage protein Hhe n=1 Tax=Amphritea sp. 1_MG-2023 TaxID=3062670 RepID=UPI0026E3A1EB|nr:DUF4011 domain-containing anti-phage protein Hhe [Amphritea sp. 1_MG-2023]MDO6564393.1 DUF4011 domain-containing protein [Amphritea sp. 1_MG-2023]